MSGPQSPAATVGGRRGLAPVSSAPAVTGASFRLVPLREQLIVQSKNHCGQIDGDFVSSTPTSADDLRVGWVDLAKGLAIALVVFGHALRGLERARQIDFDGAWGILDNVIYSFHMPMFFLVAGFLFFSALARPAGVFLRSRITRLLWPLALWTWVFFGVKMLAGSAVNTPLDESGGFPLFPLPPRDHFWFLWVLFLVSVATYVLGRLAAKWRDGVKLWTALLAADIILIGVAPPPPGVSVWFPGFSFYLGFFLLGLILSRLPLPRVSRSGMLAAFVLFVLGCVLAAIVPYGIKLEGFVLGVLICLSLCFLLRGMRSGGLGHRALLALGRASMAVYLTHTILGAPVRIALMRLGVHEVAVILLAVTLVGLLVPPLLDRLARRAGLARYLGW